MDFVVVTDYKNPNVARMKIIFNKFTRSDKKMKALNAHNGHGAKNDEQSEQDVAEEEEVRHGPTQ